MLNSSAKASVFVLVDINGVEVACFRDLTWQRHLFAACRRAMRCIRASDGVLMAYRAGTLRVQP